MKKLLNDRNIKPNDQILERFLGAAWPCWEDIKEHLQFNYNDVNESWKFYKDRQDWILQMLYKKQTLFWMHAFEGYFSISFWFGDKGVSEVENSDLPDHLKMDLINSKKYQIGRCLTMEVRNAKDIEHIKTLLSIKSDKKIGNGIGSLPNIGKDLSSKLLTLGIDTPEKLKETGTEQTYLRVKALDPGACFSLLCAIEGAIQGIRWHSLSQERKQELKQFFHMVKKQA